MRVHRDAVWVGLLAVMQLGDLWTTGLDRARGAIESMPITSMILAQGGLPGLALLKLAMLLAVATALALSRAWSRRSRHGDTLHSYVLNGCRISVVAVALVTLNNAALFTSL